MTVIKSIKNVLSIVNDLQNHEVDKFLYRKNSSSFEVRVNNEQLVEINDDSILLVGSDITAKILPVCRKSISDSISNENIESFFGELKNSLLRLNHFGISYSCISIEDERKEIKKILHGTHFKLYEEPAESASQKWYFVGNLDNWENPLFEIVLSESKTPLCTEWVPHFQIDLDSGLKFEELKILTEKYLKKDFIDWVLDIPNYGVVLAMGKLSNIDETKIYLSVSTDKRDTKFHREEILKLV